MIPPPWGRAEGVAEKISLLRMGNLVPSIEAVPRSTRLISGPSTGPPLGRLGRLFSLKGLLVKTIWGKAQALGQFDSSQRRSKLRTWFLLPKTVKGTVIKWKLPHEGELLSSGPTEASWPVWPL